MARHSCNRTNSSPGSNKGSPNSSERLSINKAMTSADDPTITVYGAPWCPHCKRVRKFLAAHRVPYDHVDIDEQPEAIERLKELQGGKQIIPLVDLGTGLTR